MNLIMSDVEETIMIVDPDGATNGQGVVNVSQSYFVIGLHISYIPLLV
jgi:small nuclear ribonucleoprotein (snRNP)-like protein